MNVAAGLLAAACVLFLSVVSAIASETIETPSFVLTLPSRWTASMYTKPVSAKGPAGELLQLSSTVLSGQGSADEAARVMRQVEEKAVKAMRLAESDPALVTVAPLKRTVLPSGVAVHEMLSRARDGKALFAQFAATGPRSVVLVSLDAPATAAASVGAIRESVVGIKWAK